jgi:hypothetical protein
MSANTAVAENFANFSVEKPLKTDSFTIVDEHYVGHDGFVVPKDFEEFYERFPRHVRNWVGRHVERSTPRQDVEDWTQDLLAHLCCLPLTSKYREAGKADIVQTFDPHRHYGASSARFFNYINLCLGNRFRTMRSTRTKDAIWRTGNFSFSGLSDAIDSGQVDDEFCHSHSEHLREGRERQQEQQYARLALAEFSDFVRREDSSLLRAMEAIAATATPGPAAELLGTTIGELCRMRSRLRQLGRCFQSGAQVPRRRRPYRRRLTKRIIFCVR